MLLVLAGISLSSCKKDLYRRPVTIDRVEFTNSAGAIYDEQFQRVNGWFLQKLKSFEEEKQTFRLDTTAKKRYRQYNFTLVASLERLEVNNQPGVFYKLYLRPNSGIDKTKGGVQRDMYNELKLFSPDSFFLRHRQQYYTDSIMAGPFDRLTPVQELYEPAYIDKPGIVSFSVDSINFPKSFKKRQREGIIRLVHNSIVLRQRQHADRDPEEGLVFNYYPNYSSKTGKKPSTYSVNLNVTEDSVSDRITVRISSPGYTPDKWQQTYVSFSRKNYLDGYDYEANQTLGSFAPSFISGLYYSKRLSGTKTKALD